MLIMMIPSLINVSKKVEICTAVQSTTTIAIIPTLKGDSGTLNNEYIYK